MPTKDKLFMQAPLLNGFRTDFISLEAGFIALAT